MSSHLAPHIVTDSTAALPPQVAEQHGIAVIACHINLSGQTYREGIDITQSEFYRRLRSWERLQTAQPGIGVFAETYRRLLADGRPVVSIHLGSGYSGVYGAACLAAQEVDPERITIVDGRQVSLCTGWLAIRAAEMAAAGASADEVTRHVHELAPRLRLFALIDDLRYLRRSGRVNLASIVLGQLFSIKPIIAVHDNHANLVGKARTLNRGLDRLVAMAGEVGPIERMAVLHADAVDTAAELAKRAACLVDRQELPIADAGTIISGHGGPGAVGLACMYAAQP